MEGRKSWRKSDDLYEAEIMQRRHKYPGLLFLLRLLYISRAKKNFQKPRWLTTQPLPAATAFFLSLRLFTKHSLTTTTCIMEEQISKAWQAVNPTHGEG